MSTGTTNRTVLIDGNEIVLKDGPQSRDGIDPETWDQVDALARSIESTPTKDDAVGSALRLRRAQQTPPRRRRSRAKEVLGSILEALAVTGPPASAVFGGYITQDQINRYRNR